MYSLYPHLCISAVPTPVYQCCTHTCVSVLYLHTSFRVAGVLGYLPQDLIGQVSYEYYHPEDIQKMVQLHHEGEHYLGLQLSCSYQPLASSPRPTSGLLPMPPPHALPMPPPHALLLASSPCLPMPPPHALPSLLPMQL